MRRIKKIYISSGVASLLDVSDKVHYYILRDGVLCSCLLPVYRGKLFKNGNMKSIQIFLNGLNGDKIDFTPIQIEVLYGLLYRLLNQYDLSYNDIVLFSDSTRSEFARRFRNWFDLAFQKRLFEPLFYMPASFLNVNTDNYV